MLRRGVWGRRLRVCFDGTKARDVDMVPLRGDTTGRGLPSIVIAKRISPSVCRGSCEFWRDAPVASVYIWPRSQRQRWSPGGLPSHLCVKQHWLPMRGIASPRPPRLPRSPQNHGRSGLNYRVAGRMRSRWDGREYPAVIVWAFQGVHGLQRPGGWRACTDLWGYSTRASSRWSRISITRTGRSEGLDVSV